ncbi:eukaryotic translation initiation factor 3 subunit J [Cantharellus anzutake]|nr:eukaryotic translation initiation factor 3 subunit J [Cantharellus anzutake]KAF8315500.1 eukaryotic translation initiation factor 3 subunit J [Cantharellus anzutake]
MTLKAKISEKEAERARQLAEDDEGESVIDEAEQRRRDKQHQLETDLANASALLSGTSVSGKSLPTEIQELLSFTPKTKDDFEAYSKKIFDAFIRKHQEKPLYAVFVEMHVKALAQSLRDVDVRKAASGLTALANEKQKEQREKASGKKKTKTASKPALAGTRSVSKVDTAAYEEALDDFDDDDFM